MSDALFKQIEVSFPAINAASDELLELLPRESIIAAIASAAELAGLLMLRATPVDLSKFSAGSTLLGAVSDESGIAIAQFVMGYVAGNGLNPKDVDYDALTAELQTYQKDLTRLEPTFAAICEKHNLAGQLRPFAAAAAGGKVVLAGNATQILKPSIGLALLMYHIAAGCKTVPYA